MGKNSKRHREAHYGKQLEYVIATEEAVNALLPSLEAWSPRVTDFHLLGPFSRDPDGHQVIYVFENNRALAKAEEKGFSKQLQQVTADELTRRGYPESGVKTLEVKLVSQKDIDPAGGEFNYFR